MAEYVRIQVTPGVTQAAVDAVGKLLGLFVTAKSNKENGIYTLLFPENGNNTFYLCGDCVPVEELHDFFDEWTNGEIEVTEMQPAQVAKFWLVNVPNHSAYVAATLPDDDCWLDSDALQLAAQIAGFTPGTEQEYIAASGPKITATPMTLEDVVQFMKAHQDTADETILLIDGAAWSLKQLVDQRMPNS